MTPDQLKNLMNDRFPGYTLTAQVHMLADAIDRTPTSIWRALQGNQKLTIDLTDTLAKKIIRRQEKT